MRPDSVGVEKTGILAARPSPAAAKTHRQPHPQQIGPKIEDLDILAVWKTLGGEPLRGGRGRAFWRRGDGYSVSLNVERRLWKDFARDEGGGILQLVQTALRFDQRTSLEWVSENFGIAIGHRRTAVERAEYAQRLEGVRVLAAELAARRDGYLRDLRTASGILLSEYHRLVRQADADQDIDRIAKAYAVFDRLDEITARRDFLRVADGPELAVFFSMFDEVAA